MKDPTASGLRLRLAACTVDLERHVATPGDGSPERPISAREIELLRYLLENPGRVVSRGELLGQLWGYDDAVVSRACDNAVARLRAKIERDPASPDHLLTVHGEGYRFEPLADAQASPAQEPVPAPSSPTLRLGAIRIDLDRGRGIGADGSVISFSPTEIGLLVRLRAAGGAVVDRSTLVADVWGRVVGDRAVDNAVLRIRAKIEEDPSNPTYLTTGAGGYRLEVARPRLPASEVPLGREALVREVVAALAEGEILALVGPGGIGKTTIARAVAADADSALWVDLGGVETPDQGIGRFAERLGITAGDEGALRIAVALSRSGPALVVLDEAETALAALGELLPRWRAAAPRVRWLVTSRIALRLGERVVPVGGLEPAAGVALFSRRSTGALRLDDPEEMRALDALVRRLDGLPLAIELAAARASVVSPAALLERIQSAALPEIGRRAGGRERHRSLDGALASTLSLLDPTQREALVRLALFRSFDHADAEGVLGPDAADRLQDLRDHALIRTREGEGALRMSAYEVVREVCAEERSEAILRDHVRWMGRLGAPERVLRLLDGADAAERAQQGEALDDLATAARIALDLGDGSGAAAAAAGAMAVWQVQGPYAPGIALGEAVLAAGCADREQATIRLLLAELHGGSRRWEEAAALLDQAMDDAGRAGDPLLRSAAALGRCSALAKQIAGIVGQVLHGAAFRDRVPASWMATYAEALRDAIAAADAAGREGMGAWLRSRYAVNVEVDLAAEAEWLARAEGAASAEEDWGVLGSILYRVQHLALVRGDRAEAIALGQRIVELRRRTGNSRELAHDLGKLAGLHADVGAIDEALREGTEAIAVARAAGALAAEANAASNLSKVLSSRGEWDRAMACLEDAHGVVAMTEKRDLLLVIESQLAAIALSANRQEEALGWAESCLQRADRDGHEEDIAIAAAMVGQCHHAAGRYAEARAAGERAVQAMDRSTPTYAIASNGCWILCKLSEVCLALGDGASAARYLDRARGFDTRGAYAARIERISSEIEHLGGVAALVGSTSTLS